MARLARVEVFAPDEIAILHVLNRTVRRCFSRPDVVAAWDDTEAARRWLMLCPKRKDEGGRAEAPNEYELNMIRNDPVRLKEIRTRLSDISWWMRLLSQKIGKRANDDDKELGKFWQARYRAVRLLDETAILACAAYVDLNPIRAAMAQTIETSEFTSAQQRAIELQESSIEQVSSGQQESSGEDVKIAPKAIARSLSPLTIDDFKDDIGTCCHTAGCRSSDKGFLPISIASYLELLDWTARQLRSDKRGATPASAGPILKRLGIDAEVWCELTRDFGKLFSTVAGKPKVIEQTRSRTRHQRYKIRNRAFELLQT